MLQSAPEFTERQSKPTLSPSRRASDNAAMSDDVSMLLGPTRRRRLGIVLSGGGSRGIAHIGVLRALQQHGIHPDCVAGTSAGAIVGALYAAGYSPERMLEFFRTKSPFRLSKLSISKPGIIDTQKVVANFEEYFPENSFEALERPLFLTSTDIIHGRRIIFDSGALIPAVLASCSMPMVFTPTEIDGNWFSDGGIVDNFPVTALEGQCEVTLGVYASPLRSVHQRDLTTSIAVLQRALEVGMFLAAEPKFGRCELLICPQSLSQYGTFDTKRLEEIEAIGYEAALEQLDAILQVVEAPVESGAEQ
jgi:NTE family protein